MRLLFDENVSPELVESVARECPASAHVRHLGLRGAPNQVIWDYAREQGYRITTCMHVKASERNISFNTQSLFVLNRINELQQIRERVLIEIVFVYEKCWGLARARNVSSAASYS